MKNKPCLLWLFLGLFLWGSVGAASAMDEASP